jgi:signal recognition particle subunit SRP19
MRKLDKAIIWPAYFDGNKTRKEGRRVPTTLAVQMPKITEIQEAANKLGLQNQVNLETHYAKAPWHKSGSILVEKKEPKEKIIQKLAKELVKIKSEQAKQQ